MSFSLTHRRSTETEIWKVKIFFQDILLRDVVYCKSRDILIPHNLTLVPWQRGMLETKTDLFEIAV